MHERERSAKNEIVAPRIVPYAFTGAAMWDGGAIDSPEQARKFVQWVAKNGGDGLKIIGGGDPIYDPEILGALLDEAKKLKLGTTTHLAQMGVARMNILQAARLGMDGMEHWYGLPEALFDRPHHPGLSGRLQLHRRVASLRPGRTALEAGRGARQREVERGHGRAAEARASTSTRRSRSTRPAAT